MKAALKFLIAGIIALAVAGILWLDPGNRHGRHEEAVAQRLQDEFDEVMDLGAGCNLHLALKWQPVSVGYDRHSSACVVAPEHDGYAMH